MSSFSFDSTNFSEQLGIYDFFGVLVSGSVFVFGLCAISTEFFHFLWDNITLGKGLGLLIIIYLIGLILQELGSVADCYVWKVRSSARKNFLKDSRAKEEELGFDTKLFRYLETKLPQKLRRGQEHPNSIIHNHSILLHYREIAKEIINELPEIKVLKNKPNDTKDNKLSEETVLIIKQKDYEKNWDTIFNCGSVCNYVHWICQYHISVSGKDKKVEKLRGLFAMSKALTVCFACLSLLSLFFLKEDSPLSILFTLPEYLHLFKNFPLYRFVFPCLAILFRLRMNRTKRNTMLTTLGTYSALHRISRNSGKASPEELQPPSCSVPPED